VFAVTDEHGDDDADVVSTVSDLWWSPASRLHVSQDTVCSRMTLHCSVYKQWKSWATFKSFHQIRRISI